MTTYFNWSDQLSVHNHKMDYQHRQLIDYINNFYDAAESGDLSKCIRSFENIVSFTTYHFKDEERMMEAAKYPQLDRHKLIHQQLVAQVTELGNKLAAGNKQAPADIKIFLKNWLTAHIKGIDMKYSDYVNDDPKQHKTA